MEASSISQRGTATALRPCMQPLSSRGRCRPPLPGSPVPGNGRPKPILRMAGARAWSPPWPQGRRRQSHRDQDPRYSTHLRPLRRRPLLLPAPPSAWPRGLPQLAPKPEKQSLEAASAQARSGRYRRRRRVQRRRSLGVAARPERALVHRHALCLCDFLFALLGLRSSHRQSLERSHHVFPAALPRTGALWRAAPQPHGADWCPGRGPGAPA
mmetsp:Transcript_85642/g.154168  ORF Transcript_85642/g.154168 Transcript_85642/m.154168 type:complete len:212 (-) Transcript_85642:611-1246(-)